MAPSDRSDTPMRTILDAATQVFARDGVDATSMVQIARAAHLGKPALYHYFDGKDALVTALAAQLFDDDADTLARVRASTAPAATVLRGYASNLAELFVRHAYLGPLFAEFCARAVRAPALQAVVGGAYERCSAAFEAVLARGVASGELDERTPDSTEHRSISRRTCRAALGAPARPGRRASTEAGPPGVVRAREACRLRA